MFEVLVSSRGRFRWYPGRGMFVAALHGLLVAGAVRVAGVAPRPEEGPAVDTTLFIVEPPAVPMGEEVSTGPAPLVAAPAFELPLVPGELPSSIPPVTGGPVLDPERLRRVITGAPSGPAGREPFSSARIPGAAEVDDPAAAIHQPAPRYPAVLRLAGIEGRVLLEFVIDSSGRLERGSARVVESSHAGFEAAALETVERSTFRPARSGGRAVRQRALQSIAFRIRPD